MRLLFFGTPRFASIALEKVLVSAHKVVAVITAPDKPSGRGRQLQQSEVKQTALAHGLEVLQPAKLRAADFLERIKTLQADLFAVVAFRILPEKLFSIPPWGAINLHASILPQWRGAAPIERALMAGATRTGVTTFQIAKDVDTGSLLMSREVEIAPSDTYEELYPRLAEVGAELLVETIDALAAGSLTPQPQDDSLACPAPKITPEDSPIDWQRPAEQIVNQIRALAGSADAYAWLAEKRLKVLRAQSVEMPNGVARPGEVIAADPRQGVVVAAGKGAVALTEVQLQGKKRLPVAAFLNGVKIAPGTRLTAS
ncbi:MAG: methionyl-tRNA formyltransferase [bacterium]